MHHGRLVLAIVCALALAAGPAASSDDPPPPVWPMAAGWSSRIPVSASASIAVTASSVILVESAQISAQAWSSGAPLWTKPLEAATRPVADEGRLFFSTADSVLALAEASGAELWRRPGRAMFAPAARAGWVIVPGEDGSLQGINSSQGREVWRIILPATLTVSPVIEGDLVIGAGADGIVRAWQVADGALRWSRPIGTKPIHVASGQGLVFVAGDDGRLFGIRHRDGRQNWVYAFHMAILGRLAVDERHVYATTIDNSVHAHTFNGHQKWRKPLAFRVVDGMVSDSGLVFVPQSNGEIRMFVAADGARAGRLNASPDESTVIGGLATGGSGADLRLALTAEAGKDIALTTYRRTGIGAVPATAAPRSTPLEVSRPGGRP